MSYVGAALLGYVCIGIAIWLGTGGVKMSRNAMKEYGLTLVDVALLDIAFVLMWPMAIVEAFRAN